MKPVKCRLLLALLAGGILPAMSVAQDADKDGPEKKSPVRESWAQIQIKGSYPEGAQMPGLFGDLSESLSDVLGRLKRATSDKSVKGVVLKISGPSIGWAKLNELSTAIRKVRDSGKPVYAYMDTASSMDYLLACNCDRIVMPEPGVLMLLGMRAEVTFYKNLFDKLSIQADMLRVGEFKSAAEPYTRTEMSPEFREEMEAILDDYYRQMVDRIASSRKLDRGAVVKAIDNGPHTASAAHELGLIDSVAYEDDVADQLKGDRDVEIRISKRYGKKSVSNQVSLFEVWSILMGVSGGTRISNKPKVAIIHADGVIMTGRSQSSPLGGAVVGSDTIVKALARAKRDKTVKAVVLRVDSPGGSALASDLIWRSVTTLGKPVVASMGDTAASGGYYISMGADAILAEPGTLTGSIGVVGGKFALKGLFEKVGVSTSTIKRGANSGVMSLVDGFSDNERAAMMRLLYEVYDQFTRKAAAGRNMPHEKLEKLARGRVYTGRMAKELNLVDELGTLDDAIAQAKTLAGLGEEDQLERLILPPPVSPFEMLFGPIDARVQTESAVRSIVPESLAGTLSGLQLVEILAREPRLTLMPFQLIVH